MNSCGIEIRRAFSMRQIGVIVIMSLGLILATIMFTVGRGYSVFKIPYAHSDRIVVVEVDIFGQAGSSQNPGSVRMRNLNFINSAPQPQSSPSVLYFACRERPDIFTEVAAYRSGEKLHVRSSQGNAFFPLIEATPNLFDMLGIAFPGLYDWKATAETQNPFPVITTDLLARTLGNTPAGQQFSASAGNSLVVAGVLPPDFVFPSNMDTGYAFKPLIKKSADTNVERQSDPSGMSGVFSSEQFTVIARLRPDITPQMAEQMLSSELPKVQPILEQMSPFFPVSNAQIRVKPLLEIMTSDSRRIMWGAWILSGLILIICAVNLAGMFLVRCSYQIREYALRNALGAVLFDLLRLLLLELAVISVIAVVISWFFARLVVATIADLLPVQYLAFGRPDFGPEALIFLISGAVVSMVIAIAPVVLVIVRNYRRGFTQNHLAMFTSHRITRIALTVSQTALAMLLFGLTHMAVRGYIDLFSRETGLSPDTRVMSVAYSSELDWTRVNEIVRQTLEKANRGVPDARVGAMQAILMDKSSTGISVINDGEKTVIVNPIGVSPGLFHVAKGKILAGREFTHDDPRSAIMLNRTLVRELGWSPQEAIGQQVREEEVIGVVEDFPTVGLDIDERPGIIRKYPPPESGSMGTIVSSGKSRITVHYMIASDAISQVGALEKEIMTSDPDAVIIHNTTMGGMFRDSVRGRTFATFSVILFALAAIGIVITNIANTVAFVITRRTREIAVHIALGAPMFSILRVVMGDMLRAGVGGILAGGIVVWWVGKTVAHFIYNGETYHTPAGIVLAGVALLAIICIAAFLPAVRALRIDPNTALRVE